MRWIEDTRNHPGRIAIAAVVALLALTILAGSVELALYTRVNQVTNEALGYDVGLEDQADDLRIAIFILGVQHRNLILSGPSRRNVANFNQAYANLQGEIDELERLGVRSNEVPQPDQLRNTARTYYTEFRPAIDLRDSDEEAFTRASDRGLVRLDSIEQGAFEIDKLAENRATNAIEGIERVSTTASVVVIAVVGGLIIIGTALAYAAARMVGQVRELYAREQQARAALAQALQTKMDFLADASHELRTPLTVVRTNAEVGAQLEDDPSQLEIFEDILKESTQMSRMVEDLLFLARSDSDSLPLEVKVLPVSTFMAEVAGRAEALSRERGAPFAADLSGDGELRADPTRLEQAILILVDNAAKYGPDEHPVTLLSTTELGELVIRVEDRGPGIPEEDLSRIFERFYRVEKARERKRGGAGLGLSIAKTIVEAHGGSIEAETLSQGGTRMSIRLPLATPPSY